MGDSSTSVEAASKVITVPHPRSDLHTVVEDTMVVVQRLHIELEVDHP